MAGVLSALVAIVGLLVAAAGSSVFFGLRNRMHAQVDKQLEQASNDHAVERAIHMVELHINISVFFWNLLEPSMQETWANLKKDGHDIERLRLLTAARGDAKLAYDAVVNLLPRVADWKEDEGERSHQLNLLRYAVMNYAFYESSLAVHFQDASGDFQYDRAKEAIRALEVVEGKLGAEPKRPEAFFALETWCWVILTCSQKSSSDPRVKEAGMQLTQLLSTNVAHRNVAEVTRESARLRYRAAGFTLDALEARGP